MREANLVGANLSGCNLRGADLMGARTERLDVTGADLRGARIDAGLWVGARLAGAVVDVEQAVLFATAHGLVLRPHRNSCGCGGRWGPYHCRSYRCRRRKTLLSKPFSVVGG